MRQVVVFGTGLLARLLQHFIETTTADRVVAFVVDAGYQAMSQFEGKPVYSYDEIDQRCQDQEWWFICALGYSNMRARQQVFTRLKADGRRFYSYISPQAKLDPTVVCGDNTIVFPNAVVEPFCQLGDNNIIWSSVVICHDTRLGSHNFLAANTTVGGCCRIGTLCFFGFGSVVIQELEIADESLIGAAAVVVRSTEAMTKYLGNPAKSVSQHELAGIRI